MIVLDAISCNAPSKGKYETFTLVIFSGLSKVFRALAPCKMQSSHLCCLRMGWPRRV